MMMKIPHYSRYDRIIHGVLILPYMLLINWLLFGKDYFTSSALFWCATLIVLLAASLLYCLITLFAIAVRDRVPHHHNSLCRGLTLILIAFAVTASLVTILFFGYDYFHFMGYELKIESYYLALSATFAFNIIGTILNEAGDAMEKWKNTITESEQLKKVNLQSQLDGLKDQINPHFLFNSLNSLSSLISEDPQKANRFLNEMSRVYRYLLRSNEDILTTLADELKFIQSYYHLLKTRYNDGISMDIRIDRISQDYCIPPLTLQLLTENAVKHNKISREQPLKIEIISDPNGFLMVRNNLQPKTLKAPSTRVGLNNIMNKYRLLNQPNIQIKETKKDFSVTVPLIRHYNETV